MNIILITKIIINFNVFIKINIENNNKNVYEKIFKINNKKIIKIINENKNVYEKFFQISFEINIC